MFAACGLILTACVACIPFVPSRPLSRLYLLVIDSRFIIKAVPCSIPPGGYRRAQLYDASDDLLWDVRSVAATGSGEFTLGTQPAGFETLMPLERPGRKPEVGSFFSLVLDDAPSIEFGAPEIDSGFYSPDLPDVTSEAELLGQNPRRLGC